jgi:phosphate starvation-inducible PhoH-like protein
MGHKRANALRREAEEFGRVSNKQTHIINNTFQEKKSNVLSINPQKQRKPIALIPKSVNQENYILALKDPNIDVVIAGGPAGTGKTYLATLAAIEAYRNKEVSRIVLCRPAVSIEGEDHGFLPGDLNAKLAPWSRPIIDTLREFYHVKEIEQMILDETIEFVALGMTRGRTFKDTFLILDESQNSSPVQLKALLTRIGHGSKFVLNGDISQSDRLSRDGGLADLLLRLKKYAINGVKVCEFDHRDIQRHRLIGEFINLYDE